VAADRITFRTTFRDTLSSRQIALIDLPCTKNARRIFAIVSTISIPSSASKNHGSHCGPTAPGSRLDADHPENGVLIPRRFTSHALLAAVARKEEADLQTALDGLTGAGLLFRQGVPPHATYLFKHGLVQDAAYSTLLRERRRALHARIEEALETQFPEIAESQPELLARHCTEAGLIEKAAAFWAKAGRRSLARSALVEAIAQLTRVLDQMATLPATPALRREQIELQVALITPLLHVKGYAAPETQAAVERARLLIDQAEALGEPPEDPLLLFSVLFGFWVANYVAFNGEVVCELAAQFLALAQKQEATVPLMIGHGLMGTSLVLTADVAQGRAHCDQAIALYNAAEHRPLAARFGQDVRVANLSYRSLALWVLGYPEAALADTDQAISDARDTGQAATLMFALGHAPLALLWSGNYVAAAMAIEEVIALSDEKGALVWNVAGKLNQGWLFALTGKAADAVQTINSGITAWRSIGSKLWMPNYLSYSARAYAEIGQLNDAWRCIGEAMMAVETTKEGLWEAEIHRMAGEIARKSEADALKAEKYFERALAVARKQQAKSWELRAAMSMARLWRDQGKQQQARELLAPVYSWFTEGFDTRDLKEAKMLLDELRFPNRG
jgi:predicted ATPase